MRQFQNKKEEKFFKRSLYSAVVPKKPQMKSANGTSPLKGKAWQVSSFPCSEPVRIDEMLP